MFIYCSGKFVYVHVVLYLQCMKLVFIFNILFRTYLRVLKHKIMANSQWTFISSMAKVAGVLSQLTISQKSYGGENIKY